VSATKTYDDYLRETQGISKEQLQRLLAAWRLTDCCWGTEPADTADWTDWGAPAEAEVR